ncbi:MAG: hypothetical protein KAH23_07115 [Kiritimatiellae bacterium]|nr:hypothetical protein [Kiritimatiellia bacterium]
MDHSLIVNLFFILLVSGLMLVGAEVFIPGGILGALGGFALFGAIIAGFTAFGSTAGVYIACGIFMLVGLVVFLWIKVFPKTGIGKAMTVSRDLSDAEGTEPGLDQLLNRKGEAISDLRPAGFARIDGRRVDVITSGGMIDKGSSIRVVEIEGNRVVVKQIEE